MDPRNPRRPAGEAGANWCECRHCGRGGSSIAEIRHQPHCPWRADRMSPIDAKIHRHNLGRGPAPTFAEIPVGYTLTVAYRGAGGVLYTRGVYVKRSEGEVYDVGQGRPWTIGEAGIRPDTVILGGVSGKG